MACFNSCVEMCPSPFLSKTLKAAQQTSSFMYCCLHAWRPHFATQQTLLTHHACQGWLLGIQCSQSRHCHLHPHLRKQKGTTQEETVTICVVCTCSFAWPAGFGIRSSFMSFSSVEQQGPHHPWLRQDQEVSLSGQLFQDHLWVLHAWQSGKAGTHKGALEIFALQPHEVGREGQHMNHQDRWNRVV